MFSKYNKIHTGSLIIGIILMAVSYVFDLSFISLKMDTILKIIAGIFFIMSMFYYYKIISILSKVTDITSQKVWIAITSHIITLIALYFWNNNLIFYLLFIGSILVRSATGITIIDRDMKSLCYQLDMELFEISKKQEL